ncbi:MAG TPA: hypothetical protein V6D06_15695 [Trichocoleus sp.]
MQTLLQTQHFSFVNELAPRALSASELGVIATESGLTGGELVASGITTDPMPANTPSEDTSIQEGISAGAGILLLVGVFLMLRRTSFQRKAERSRTRGGLESNRSPIPCQDCRYFHPNTFLPCAVNPGLALRKEAADCTDYSPRHNESVSKSVHN